MDDETLTQKKQAEHAGHPGRAGGDTHAHWRNFGDAPGVTAWLRGKRKHRQDASSFVRLRLRHLREHGPKEADVVFLILDDSLEIGHDVGVLDGFCLPAVFSNGRQLALDGVLKKGPAAGDSDCRRGSSSGTGSPGRSTGGGSSPIWWAKEAKMSRWCISTMLIW